MIYFLVMTIQDHIYRVGQISPHSLVFSLALGFIAPVAALGLESDSIYYRVISTSTFQGGLLPGRPVTDTLYFAAHRSGQGSAKHITLDRLKGADFTDRWVSKGTIRSKDTLNHGILSQDLHCVSRGARAAATSRPISYDFALPLILRSMERCPDEHNKQATRFIFYTPGIADGMFYFDTLSARSLTHSKTDSVQTVTIAFDHSRRLHMDMREWENGNGLVLDFCKSGITRIEYTYRSRSEFPILIVGTSNLRGTIYGLPATLDPETASAMRQTSLVSEIRMQLIE